MKTGEVTRSLADELTEVRDISSFIIIIISIHVQIAKCVTTARIQLENRIEQQRGFLVELDSLINWLKNFINESKTIDNQVSKTKKRIFLIKYKIYFFQTIKLALNERQQHFEELIKCSQLDDHRVKHKIDNLIQMWNQLTSMSKFKFLFKHYHHLISIQFLFFD